MTADSGPLAYRQLRAPTDDGGSLVVPGPDAWRDGVLENQRRIAGNDEQGWAGMSIGDLRRFAREQLLAEARRHTGQYRDIDGDMASASPLLLTGHQPQLFHPGVWFKNFVLAALARQVAAPAVNLIIDNDTIRAAAIRVPRVANLGDAGASMIEFDRPGDEVPFEERAVLDMDRFRSFPHAIRSELANNLPDPLVDSLWPEACAALADTDRLGLCLSRARNVIESEAGISVLDVPLSAVCDGWPFRWFATGLLEDAERFREVHNSVLAEYRRTHRIRSRSHPVPELARDGAWCEAPFWLWTSDFPRRRRLFARRLPDMLELTDRTSWRLTLARPGDGDAKRAVEQLEEARRQGVKLRPRALLTTLFARLLLSDHFVHGIGGAKYDQLTDSLFERYLRLTPPSFVTATATLRLPVASSISPSPSNQPESRRVIDRLRALRFHPEFFLSDSQLSEVEVARLVAEKRHWLQVDSPRGSRLARHRALGALNESLHHLVRHLEPGLLADLAAARREERRRALLRSREFSYVLFPKNWLVPRLLELAAPTS